MASDRTAADFLAEYERRTNAHDVAPWSELVAPDATYWFTNGSHVGKEAVVAAVEHNFTVIQDETYAISDVEWVIDQADYAVVRYRFNWSGIENGEPASGSGRGTNVMVQRDGSWFMVHEHLSV